jgi:hypothetical protein
VPPLSIERSELCRLVGITTEAIAAAHAGAYGRDRRPVAATPLREAA